MKPGRLLPLLFFSIALNFPLSSWSQERSDTLIMGAFRPPEIINPIFTIGGISALLTPVIFDSLVMIDDTLTPVPDLAERWEASDDGKSWTFYLKKGVKFHNGVELTAQDVEFTYKTVITLKESRYNGTFKEISRVSTNGRYIVLFQLKNPDSYFPHKLTVGIIPKRKYKGNSEIQEDGFDEVPIGTGAYKLIKWGTNEIVLKKNDDYFKEHPKIGTIRIKFYKNQKVMLGRLMREEVDLAIDMPATAKLIYSNSQYKTYSYLLPYYLSIAFNLNNELFNDSRVRKALNYAIDKQLILEQVFKRKGHIASGSIYPQSLLFNKELAPYPFNPSISMALLKQAGWSIKEEEHLLSKNGRKFRFKLTVGDGNALLLRVLSYIQEQLLDIGVEVSIKEMPADVNVQNVLIKQFEATNMYQNSKMDLESSYTFLHSSQIKNGLNFYSYSNPKVDILLDTGRNTLDPEKRKEIAYKFQQELHNDPPGIFLFWRELSVAVNKRIKGVGFSPGEFFASINRWYIEDSDEHQRLSYNK